MFGGSGTDSILLLILLLLLLGCPSSKKPKAPLRYFKLDQREICQGRSSSTYTLTAGVGVLMVKLSAITSFHTFMYSYFKCCHLQQRLPPAQCCICSSIRWLPVDLRVGSTKSTWAFQVGSSRSVVVLPSKFSGAVGLIASHFKLT